MGAATGWAGLGFNKTYIYLHDRYDTLDKLYFITSVDNGDIKN